MYKYKNLNDYPTSKRITVPLPFTLYLDLLQLSPSHQAHLVKDIIIRILTDYCATEFPHLYKENTP